MQYHLWIKIYCHNKSMPEADKVILIAVGGHSFSVGGPWFPQALAAYDKLVETS